MSRFLTICAACKSKAVGHALQGIPGTRPVRLIECPTCDYVQCDVCRQTITDSHAKTCTCGAEITFMKRPT